MTDRPRFKVLVFPNGRMIITTEMALSHQQVSQMQAIFKEWVEKDHGLLLIPEAELQLAEVEYTPFGELKIVAPRVDEEAAE